MKKKRKNQRKTFIINIILSLITIPAIILCLNLAIAMLKPAVTSIKEYVKYRNYHNVSYQELNNFLPLSYNPCKKDNDCGKAITSEKEYDQLKLNWGSRYSYPTIDFNRNSILISKVSYGDCVVINRRVYRDDTNKKILHTTFIRPTIESYINGCSDILITETKAIVIPKSTGYTVEFQVERDK